MSNIIITAESGSDLPREYASKNDIYIIPMYVIFDDNSRKDGTFPVTDICDYYERTHTIPKTSGCSPADFDEFFDEIHERFPDKLILHMAYSSVTTCSWQSALLAAKKRKYVACMDTKQVSLGQAAAIMCTAEHLKQKPEWTLQEAKSIAAVCSDRIRMSSVPDSLMYLKAGGRVSNAAALCGDFLQIHPCIELKDGYLKVTRKYRGSMNRIIRKMISMLGMDSDISKEEIWIGGTVGLTAEMKKTAITTAEENGFQTIFWINSGGVITTHGGPCAFAVAGRSLH